MTEEVTATEEAAIEVAATEIAQVAALRAKLVQAELRTAAARAGMIDLDGVKLVDASHLSVTESGDLIEAPDIMARLRVEKPWLFGRGSSSSAAVAPRATPPKPKTAMEMSVDEWRVARAELLRRR